MMRKVVLVVDPPTAGGRVLPYDGPMVDFFGYQPQPQAIDGRWIPPALKRAQ